MKIWHENYDHEDPELLDKLNAMTRDTVDELLGIRYTEIGEDYLCGTVKVDQRTVQPFGILHGGVSVLLAESLGSLGGNLCVDPQTSMCVGLDVNANHLSAVRDGLITGTAKPVHIGNTTQVWMINLKKQSGKLTCIARLTLAVIPRDAATA